MTVFWWNVASGTLVCVLIAVESWLRKTWLDYREQAMASNADAMEEYKAAVRERKSAESYYHAAAEALQEIEDRGY